MWMFKIWVKVLREAGGIVKEQSGNFLKLTALFLLPISISLYLFIYFTLQPYFHTSTTTTTYTSQHLIKTIPLLLLLLLVHALFQCAVGTITYASYHGLHGRPVKLLSAVKSLRQTFVPLLATAIVSRILLLVIGLPFGFSVALIIKFGYASGIGAIILIGFVAAVVVYVELNWAVASVVVVAESKWGLAALRRSAYLVKGMRWVSFILMWSNGAGAFSFLIGGAVAPLLGGGGGGGGWLSLSLSFSVVDSTLLGISLILNYMVAMTVVYRDCKAMRGELAEEEEMLTGEYVTLPFPHDDVEL